MATLITAPTRPIRPRNHIEIELPANRFMDPWPRNRSEVNTNNNVHQPVANDAAKHDSDSAMTTTNKHRRSPKRSDAGPTSVSGMDASRVPNA